MLALGEFRSQRLREWLSLWGQQDNALAGRDAFAPFRSGQRFHCCKDRFRLQHHAVAAAKGPIVYDVVFVGGPRAQIVRPNIYQARRTGPANNPVIESFAKIAGEDRNDINAKHGD